jgi:hypothetical protein
MPLQLHVNKGLNDLDFGQKQEKAILLFGEPDETQTLNDEIMNSSLVLHYHENDLALFFDLNDDGKFNAAETSNRDTMLFGVNVFKLNEKDLTALMKENGLKLSETEKHTWGEKRLSFDEAGLDFYFESNRMVSLNFSAA